MCAQSDVLEKARVIEEYRPLVRKMVMRFVAKLPPSVEAGDMMQVAYMGLIDASNTFSDAGGASFETYASQRIRGAMLDELREIDTLSRAVRKQENAVARSVQRLEHQLGRRATESEVAHAIGEPIEKYQALVADLHCGHQMYLEDLQRYETYDGDDRGEEFVCQALACEDHDPLVTLEAEEMRQTVVDILNELPEQQRKIMYLRYEAGLPFSDIAKEFGLSEGRICQIRNVAIDSIRKQLAERLETSF